MTSPHPDLVPLLEQYGISWEEFSRKGRLPKNFEHIKAARSAIVTNLHVLGTPWTRMVEITGFSLGSIARITKATWNEASRENRRQSAAQQGRRRKGEKKSWLRAKMTQDWIDGKFDFHNGRVCSPEERKRLRQSFTPERRAQMSVLTKERWKRPSFRDPLLAFHRSDEQRQIRSEAQTTRFIVHQGTGRLMSIPAWYEPARCATYPIFTKSSYERAACDMLDADDSVRDYDYEPRFVSDDGFNFCPDFVVRSLDGSTTLIEVKASWVLKLQSTHPLLVRLDRARTYALEQGWGFRILTEKNGLQDALSARKDQERLLRRAA